MLARTSLIGESRSSQKPLSFDDPSLSALGSAEETPALSPVPGGGLS